MEKKNQKRLFREAFPDLSENPQTNKWKKELLLDTKMTPMQKDN